MVEINRKLTRWLLLLKLLVLFCYLLQATLSALFYSLLKNPRNSAIFPTETEALNVWGILSLWRGVCVGQFAPCTRHAQS